MTSHPTKFSPPLRSPDNFARTPTRRLALDTSTIIAVERRRIQPGAFLKASDNLAMSVISLAEFRAGRLLADETHEQATQRFLDALVQRVDVLPYDDAVLEQHVRLLAWTKAHGVPRGQHDLIIAATAAATGRTLVTLDKRAHFDELPGVTAIALLP